MTDFCLFFFCFPVQGSSAACRPSFTHISAYLCAGNKATPGPFTEMNSRLFSVETFILFLLSVRIWFMALNPLSHSAVEIGSVETVVSTLRRFSPVTPWHFNSWNSVSFLHECPYIWSSLWQILICLRSTPQRVWPTLDSFPKELSQMCRMRTASTRQKLFLFCERASPSGKLQTQALSYFWGFERKMSTES